MAEKRESNQEKITVQKGETVRPLNTLHVGVEVDCSQALKRLKAVTREAKKATAALRELEEQQVKYAKFQDTTINLDGRQIAKIMEDHMDKLRRRGASI